LHFSGSFWSELRGARRRGKKLLADVRRPGDAADRHRTPPSLVQAGGLYHASGAPRQRQPDHTLRVSFVGDPAGLASPANTGCPPPAGSENRQIHRRDGGRHLRLRDRRGYNSAFSVAQFAVDLPSVDWNADGVLDFNSTARRNRLRYEHFSVVEP
jgi:hypothetical protein